MGGGHNSMAPHHSSMKLSSMIFTTQMDFLLVILPLFSHNLLTLPHTEIHTQSQTYEHTHFFFFFCWKGPFSASKNNRTGRKNKGPSLTKHPSANNRKWIMQQEFNYNKCLKNKGSDRHWDLGCAKLTGYDFRLCLHHEMSPVKSQQLTPKWKGYRTKWDIF